MAGSRLLQLGRARSVIAIISARAKVNDFEDDFFMGLLGLKEEVSKLVFCFVVGQQDTTCRMFWLLAYMEAYACAAFCRRILDGLCPIGRFAIGYW